jgi:peptidyl-prolyl cis-trans isomerase C
MIRNRLAMVLATAFLSLSVLPVWAMDPDHVLISRDGISVTRADFDRYVRIRIPEEHREATLSRPGNARELIGQVFTSRMLAREAEAIGDLDSDELRWQVALQRDRLLAEALLVRRIAEASAGSDWGALAQAHYTANLGDFVTPERVGASHVLIRTGGERTDAEALELAEEIAGRARAGEDFGALAAEFSEDPSAASNRGDLGRFGRGQMVPEFEEAAFALEQPGDIAGPVQSQFGYHVIRLNDRQASEQRPFEAVRESIISTLQSRQAREIRQAEVERVRSMEGIVVDQDAVSALEQEFVTEAPGASGEGRRARPAE